MDDPFALRRFVEAQERAYPQVCAELRRGRKTSHWMWFAFPQIRGLGHSPMARKFAIASLAEARAYLDHPVLGARLRECTELVVEVERRTASEIFGYPDDLKFRSSMTLFSLAAVGRSMKRGTATATSPTQRGSAGIAAARRSRARTRAGRLHGRLHWCQTQPQPLAPGRCRPRLSPCSGGLIPIGISRSYAGSPYRAMIKG